MHATIFAKISSLIPFENDDLSISSASQILGTLIVCGPTPKTASKCSACINNPANSYLYLSSPNNTPRPTSSIPPSIALSIASV